MNLWKALVLCACFLVSPAIAQPERVVDVPNGYSISVPDTWVRVPDEEIAMLIEITKAANRDNAYTYLAGFSPTGSMASMPYMIVQKNHAGFRGATSAQIAEAFGAKTLNTELADIEQTTGGLISDLAIEQPVLDIENARALIRANAGSAGDRMDVYMVVYLGMDSSMQLNFYTPDGEMENHIGTFNEMSDTFSYTKASQRWTPKSASGRGSSLVTNAIVGGVIGVVCVLVVSVFSKKKA